MRMMAALSYERVTAAGADALAEWERLRSAGRGWPIVVGDDDALERIADQFSMADPQVYAENVKKGIGMPSLHSAHFAPVPEPTLKTGVTAMTTAALDLLQ